MLSHNFGPKAAWQVRLHGRLHGRQQGRPGRKAAPAARWSCDPDSKASTVARLLGSRQQSYSGSKVVLTARPPLQQGLPGSKANPGTKVAPAPRLLCSSVSQILRKVCLFFTNFASRYKNDRIQSNLSTICCRSSPKYLQSF